MYQTDDKTPLKRLILRERMQDNRAENERKGWLIILAQGETQREILAVLNREVGLEYAKSFANLLAKKYNLAKVSEELSL